MIIGWSLASLWPVQYVPGDRLNAKNVWMIWTCSDFIDFHSFACFMQTIRDRILTSSKQLSVVKRFITSKGRLKGWTTLVCDARVAQRNNKSCNIECETEQTELLNLNCKGTSRTSSWDLQYQMCCGTNVAVLLVLQYIWCCSSTCSFVYKV